MILWDSIQSYLDPVTGLMMAGGDGKDNLILDSAYLLRGLTLNNELDAAAVLRKRMIQFLLSVEVAPGLYYRNVGDTNPNSIDNLIGTCVIPEAAQATRKRWNWHLSCFDVNNPNKFAFNANFFGRFLGVKSHIVASSGSKPWLIQRLIWIASVYYSVKYSTGSSDPLLLSLQVDAMEKYCHKTCAYWKSHYTLKALYTEYFGATHPLTLAS